MTVTKIGYSRVSTLDQNLSAQREALSKAGCKVIYEDQVSGKSIKRPKLRAMLDYIRDGDIVVVTRLDRLARSTKDLLSIAEEIQEKGAGLEVAKHQSGHYHANRKTYAYHAGSNRRI